MNAPPGSIDHASASASGRRVVAWVFVAVQAALLVGMVAGPRDAAWVAGDVARAIGLGLLILGAALGVWAAAHLGRGLTPSPLPNGATDLVTRGPYGFVRHPMYTAVMLIAAGISIRAGSVAVLLQAIALVLLFSFKARWEEARLSDTFPGYPDYVAATPRFVPFS